MNMQPVNFFVSQSQERETYRVDKAYKLRFLVAAGQSGTSCCKPGQSVLNEMLMSISVTGSLCISDMGHRRNAFLERRLM